MIKDRPGVAALRYALLIVLSVLFLLPFYVLLRNAFATPQELASARWVWVPHEISADNLRRLRSETDRTICVGFGIHRPEQVRQLVDVADGAIVGTAFVRRMTERLNDGPAAIAAAVAEYCRELSAAVSR